MESREADPDWTATDDRSAPDARAGGPGEPGSDGPAGRGATGREGATMNMALFGGFAKAPPAPGWKRETAVAILGGGELDLTRSAPGEDARLTAIALLGGIDVRVPEGARVAMSGLSLLGGREVKVVPGDGPVIRIRAIAILGGVAVATGSPAAAPSTPDRP